MDAPKILVVEDNPQIADSLIDMLRLKRYPTITARSGAEGIRLAESEQPALIMLDIRLPDMEGYDVFDAIRANPAIADTKILIVTASESTDNIAKRIDLPRADIVYKPEWSLTKLLAKIESKLAE